MNLNLNRDYLGKAFFLIGVLMFIVMFVSPLNHLIIFKDEYFTLTVLKFPIWDIITININDVHPPAYYLILKAILKVLACFNINYDVLFALKLTSIIPYGLILAFSATLLRRKYGWLAAGIFALALASMSEFFFYFMIVRMYSFGVLFLLLSFYFYKRILDDSDKKSWIALTFFSVLGAYTHYFVALSSFVMYLMLLTFILKNGNTRKVEIRKFACSVLACVALYVPWVLALIKQLSLVHDYFWVEALTLNDLVKCLAYFATNNGSAVIEATAILSLVFFLAVLLRQYSELDNNDSYFILSGFCVFIGTLVIGSILSVTYKPILIARYLIPASAVIWVSISILVSKIKDRKLLAISLALIVLLCIAGISDVVDDNNYYSKLGNGFDNLLNEVNEDADIIIINNQHGLLEFGDYLNDTDIYTPEFDGIYGVDNGHVHRIYSFRELNSTQLSDLVENNSDKSIYFLDVGGPEKLDQFNWTSKGKIVNDDITFYKLNADS